jgi:Zn-dependent peptidase ImmA (M78 family)/transcriptional regulator with XRE-family HTH domain
MGDIIHNLHTRLAEVRALVSLSQTTLAGKMGVSPSLISHWEKGTRTPSETQLLDLARHLGITLDYLLNSEIRPSFQCRARVTSPQRDSIDQTLLDASMQVHAVDTAYRLAGKIPQPFILRADFGSTEALPSVTSHLRDTLKLNRRVTLDELKQALSEWNIFVFDWAMPRDLSGVSFRGAFSAIFINHLQPPTRRLFTLAHEFAHVVFHLGRDNAAGKDRMETQVSIASHRDPLEKQANAFASEFLMPRSDLEALVAKHKDRLRDPAMLEAVARNFNVSRDAIFYRLTQLEFFRWSDKSAYFGGTYPLPDAPKVRVADWKNIDSQVDARFRDTALSLYQEEKISTGKLAEWFFTPRHVVEEYLAELRQSKEQVISDEPAQNHEGEAAGVA